MPDAVIQVLKHAHIEGRETRSTATSLTADLYSPFSALGVPKLKQARTLNTVNKMEVHKRYRKLEYELNPERCEHEYALPAMQALNMAYAAVLPEGNGAKTRWKKAGGNIPRQPAERQFY